MKRYIVGRYLLDHLRERSEFIANLRNLQIIPAVRLLKLKLYPERFYGSPPPAQVQQQPRNTFAKDQTSTPVVVGSPDVCRYSKKYHVVEYSSTRPNGSPAKVDISVQDLFQKHILLGLGGKDKIDAVKSLFYHFFESISRKQVQKLEGTFVRKLKSPGMERTSMAFKVMKQDSWVSGDKAWTHALHSPQKSFHRRKQPKRTESHDPDEREIARSGV